VELALVTATLGRLDQLQRLFESIGDRLQRGDELVVVAQERVAEVEALAARYRASGLPVTVVTSDRGAALGRNAGVAALTRSGDPLLVFPNDTTWFPPGSLEALRSLPDHMRVGAVTIVDETGPKFVLPDPGSPLDRLTVWTVIEMGLLVRRRDFDAAGGFDPAIGTGAPTPWQAGEVTDLLLRLQRAGLADEMRWMPASVWFGGIADAYGLSRHERRRKLRGYGRGLGRLVTRWRWPLWWRFAFIGGGLLFGVRHGRPYGPLDGAWVLLGRLEGALGRTLGGSTTAVTR